MNLAKITTRGQQRIETAESQSIAATLKQYMVVKSLFSDTVEAAHAAQVCQ
jgi:hypothetical protein